MAWQQEACHNAAEIAQRDQQHGKDSGGSRLIVREQQCFTSVPGHGLSQVRTSRCELDAELGRGLTAAGSWLCSKRDVSSLTACSRCSTLSRANFSSCRSSSVSLASSNSPCTALMVPLCGVSGSTWVVQCTAHYIQDSRHVTVSIAFSVGHLRSQTDFNEDHAPVKAHTSEGLRRCLVEASLAGMVIADR